jgi:hypothetical protein
MTVVKRATPLFGIEMNSLEFPTSFTIWPGTMRQSLASCTSQCEVVQGGVPSDLSGSKRFHFTARGSMPMR